MVPLDEDFLTPFIKTTGKGYSMANIIHQRVQVSICNHQKI